MSFIKIKPSFSVRDFRSYLLQLLSKKEGAWQIMDAKTETEHLDILLHEPIKSRKKTSGLALRTISLGYARRVAYCTSIKKQKYK